MDAPESLAVVRAELGERLARVADLDLTLLYGGPGGEGRIADRVRSTILDDGSWQQGIVAPVPARWR